MNEIIAVRENRRPWLIALAVLFAWGLGATITAAHFVRSCRAIQESIATAGTAELPQLIEQHGETINVLLGDIGAGADFVRAANGNGRELDDRIWRAYLLAESTDAGFIEFRESMAGAGGTLQDIIARQKRIDELFVRSEANNRAIKMELGMCIGADN